MEGQNGEHAGITLGRRGSRRPHEAQPHRSEQHGQHGQAEGKLHRAGGAGVMAAGGQPLRDQYRQDMTADEECQL